MANNLTAKMDKERICLVLKKHGIRVQKSFEDLPALVFFRSGAYEMEADRCLDVLAAYCDYGVDRGFRDCRTAINDLTKAYVRLATASEYKQLELNEIESLIQQHEKIINQKGHGGKMKKTVSEICEKAITCCDVFLQMQEGVWVSDANREQLNESKKPIKTIMETVANTIDETSKESFEAAKNIVEKITDGIRNISTGYFNAANTALAEAEKYANQWAELAGVEKKGLFRKEKDREDVQGKQIATLKGNAKLIYLIAGSKTGYEQIAALKKNIPVFEKDKLDAINNAIKEEQDRIDEAKAECERLDKQAAEIVAKMDNYGETEDDNIELNSILDDMEMQKSVQEDSRKELNKSKRELTRYKKMITKAKRIVSFIDRTKSNPELFGRYKEVFNFVAIAKFINGEANAELNEEMFIIRDLQTESSRQVIKAYEEYERMEEAAEKEYDALDRREQKEKPQQAQQSGRERYLRMKGVAPVVENKPTPERQNNVSVDDLTEPN